MRRPGQTVQTNRRLFEFGAIRIYRLADGRGVDTWAHQDSMGLMRQLRD
ncbi:hypothetical protein [Actinomycetospora termitidis]|uniref:Ester cyclase n=1 Tax=Actinomycetospora termitidis TaxID=3053470 RepID=A0ABT7M1M4_9PSEU|nr:hypothetical protein [Actinomycetospora sp. Odt1-22]MDL5154361.1 hypothetical protein [Actinomycetospora sp. Odt1-22]